MNLKALKSSLLQLVVSLLFLACTQVQDLCAMPSVQETVLPNRLIVLHSEDHSLPFVTLELLIDAGSARDPSGQEGLAHLTAKSLLLGTSRRTAAEINEELDFMGSVLGASAGRDYSTVSLRFLKKDMDAALGLFIEVLTEPKFPEDEIKREIEKTMAAIQSEEDQPGAVAEKEFQKALFLTSPYGHPVIGTKESLPRITRDAVSRFYKSFYHPNNYILAVVGDISRDEVKSKIFPHFEKMEIVEVPPEDFKAVFAKGPEIIKIDREITQANIIIGNAGISRDNPDFYAVSVMNYILGGGGFASRLLEEIRNKRGLAYSVSSFFDAGKYPGSFQIVLQTKNLSASEAVSIARQQTERIQKEPVSDKEIEGAKKYLTGSFPLRLDTQGKLADFLLQVQYYKLGLDYAERYPILIKSVTKEDILAAAKKYLHPENFVIVAVADMKEAKLDSRSSDRASEKKDDPPAGSASESNLIGEKSEECGSGSVAGKTQSDVGIAVGDISAGCQRKFNIQASGGVVVLKVLPGSVADDAGMRTGDVIVEADHKPVKNLKDFESVMRIWAREKDIEFLIERGGQKLYVVMGTRRK